jgi:hypothetical protein
MIEFWDNHDDSMIQMFTVLLLAIVCNYKSIYYDKQLWILSPIAGETYIFATLQELVSEIELSANLSRGTGYETPNAS